MSMAGEVQSYQDLKAWQRAYALGLTLYQFSARLPDSERFGLTSSIRRTALLVARLIAEGFGKGNPVAYAQLLRNARSLTYDIDTQLMFAVGLGYASKDECDSIRDQVTECGKVLSGLIRKIENPDA
jgi:four helix bundle protein